MNALVAALTTMPIYLKTGARDHLMFVMPGNDDPGSQWRLEDGTLRQFTVRFVAGKAVVDKALGNWMLHKELAQAWPSRIQVVNRHVQVEGPRVRIHRLLDGKPRQPVTA